MSKKSEPEPRRRGPIFYTVAVVVAVAVGATGIFLVGSANRRSDRNALLAYERAILPHVREAGRIVQQEMKPTLREISDGAVTDSQILERSEAWQRVFERVRADLLALKAPGLLGDIDQAWSAAMGGYLLAVDTVAAIARAAPDQRTVAIDQAATFGERADQLFDTVASIIQFHRKRLGLGPSLNLPDPTPTPSA
ncbi:MAG: hypothetical protein ACRDJ1_07950 [Actinomycetota bacterium]